MSYPIVKGGKQMDQKIPNWKELIKTLNSIREEQGISTYKLAELTGLHQSNVVRFFGARYCPKIEMFDKIANCLGYQLALDQL